MQAVNFSGKQESLIWINEFKPEVILDAGSGVGTYGALLRQFTSYPITTLHSLDIDPLLAQKYGLQFNYNWLFVGDLRAWERFGYDLIIFDDILEHMAIDEAISIWDKCSREAKYALISISNDILEPKNVLSTFSNITRYQKCDKVSIFWAEFNAGR